MGQTSKIKGRIAETIYPNGQGAITAASHQQLLLDMVDEFDKLKADREDLEATDKALQSLKDKVENLPDTGNFNPSGTYPDLVAGDLAGHGESVPAEYTFRASGGKSIKDGRAYIKAIKGNSVVWNNMVDTRGYEGQLYITTGIRIVEGHKYLLYRTETNQGLYLIPVVNGVDNYDMVIRDGEHSGIFQAQYSDDNGQGKVYSEAYCGACIISDLTKMFGQGNEPTTLEEYEARKPIVEDEYAYNEGEVIHCNTEGIKSVGDNAVSFEGEFVRDTNVSGEQNKKYYQEGKVYVGCEASGYVNPNAVSAYSRYDNGFKISSANGYGIGYYVKILPNQEYHISANIVGNGSIQVGWYSEDGMVLGYTWENNATYKTPSNAQYGLVCLTPANANDVIFTDIMLTLVHSGWKVDTDAGYQPYWQDTLPLPIISKYFPQGMKKAGSAHDEIRFNKATNKWEAVQRIGSVDLGTLEWSEGIYNGYSAFYSPDNALNGLWADHIFYLCAKYQPAQYRIHTEGLDKSIAFNNGYYGASSRKDEIVIRDSSYTDAASFKAAMQGVILYYELAEPIVTEITEDFRDYYKVADFGTEELITSMPSAPFSADIIYQFNAVDMIREHELEITELQKVIATMQAQLASLTNN